MPDGREREARPLPRLHVVTDDATLDAPHFHARAAAVLEAGSDQVALHIRGPRRRGRALYTVAERLRTVATATGSMLVINDRVDVALALGLSNVHLGRRSLPPGEVRRLLGPSGRIGVSIHAPPEAAQAAGARASWLFIGTVYETLSHPGRAGGGAGLVAAAVAEAGGTPALAIGGLDEARVAEVRAAGAHGVAVISGVWSAPDPTAAVSRYLVALAAGAGLDTGER